MDSENRFELWNIIILFFWYKFKKKNQFLGTTTASNGEGEEMIVSDANHGQEGQYVSFQMPDGSSQRGTLVLAHDGNGDNQGQEGYIVVTAQEDDKVLYSL